MVSNNKRRTLLRLYNTPQTPSSFGSIQHLLNNAKKENPSITLKDVREFLEGEDAYTLHKNTFKRFPRRKIIAPKPGVIASCDLADMALLHRQNRGYKYILVFIDIFSRFAQAVPIKRKDGKTMVEALKNILNSGHFNNLRRLNSDEGKEFYNKHVQQLLDSKGIILYSVSSKEIKASIAERFIRTIKGKLYKYMTHNNVRSYIDVLPSIIQSYNNTPHRGLGKDKTPSQIHNLTTNDEIREQFKIMYKSNPTPAKSFSSKLTIGQVVRIADEKRNWVFRKGYTIQNTLELFKIKRIDISQSPTVYYLEDLQGDPIKGVFYREELVPSKLPEFFRIDIIRSKTVAGRKKYLVKWRGYPDSFNSWIDQEQVAPA